MGLGVTEIWGEQADGTAAGWAHGDGKELGPENQLRREPFC